MVRIPMMLCTYNFIYIYIYFIQWKETAIKQVCDLKHRLEQIDMEFHKHKQEFRKQVRC